MEISVRNIFCSVFLICIKFFTVYCKCRSVKYMKRTITDRVFYFFYFLFCAFSYNFIIERCDLICAFCKSFAPVSVNSCSINHALYCICVIYTPVHRCGSKCCIRSNRCHINVITNARNAGCLTCCRSTCCICMLADKYAAIRN